MNRKLKALGLALLCACALSAVGAQGAGAEPVTGHFLLDGAGTLTGDEIGGDHLMVTSSQAKLTCKTAHFDGVGTQPAVSNTAKFTPTYTDCFTDISIFTFPTTVTHNSCHYAFRGTESDMDIECVNDGDAIVVDIYVNETDHKAGTTLCTLIIGEQTVEGITYTNTSGSPADFDILATAGGISLTRSGSSLCGSITQTGQYTGNITVTAFNEAEEAIGGEVG